MEQEPVVLWSAMQWSAIEQDFLLAGDKGIIGQLQAYITSVDLRSSCMTEAAAELQ